MDPITTVGAGLAIIGSKDLLVKILGPTADYLGGELQDVVQKCNINLDNVFSIAANKLGERLDEPGQVNSRVLKHIIDEGRFCEDELAAEYFGGILASSKTENGRDDRGVSIITSIKSLSVYQIRLHYLYYHILRELLIGKGLSMGTDRTTMGIYIPIDVYLGAMDFSDDEDPGNILTHSVNGLARHGFIDDNWVIGNKEHLSKNYKDANTAGCILEPTIQGAEAFLWANGISGANGSELFVDSITIDESKINIIKGSVAING